jgi:hypothetical protein
MTVSPTATAAVTRYLQKGIARGPAIGIVACLWYESKLNPGSQGAQSTETPGALNPGGAYGIASWNGPRQEALARFAASKKVSVEALTTQLDFVLTESANSYPSVWAAIQAGGSYADFIPIFVADYENPANHAAEINAALATARELDAAIPAAVPVPAPIPTPAPVLAPLPVATPVGGFTMNPALIASLAPLVEAVVLGLIKAFNAQLTAQLGAAAPAPVAAPIAAPTIDPQQLGSTIASTVANVLAQSIPGLIAAELAKVLPTTKAQ